MALERPGGAGTDGASPSTSAAMSVHGAQGRQCGSATRSARGRGRESPEGRDDLRRVPGVSSAGGAAKRRRAQHAAAARANGEGEGAGDTVRDPTGRPGRQRRRSRRGGRPSADDVRARRARSARRGRRGPGPTTAARPWCISPLAMRRRARASRAKVTGPAGRPGTRAAPAASCGSRVPPGVGAASLQGVAHEQRRPASRSDRGRLRPSGRARPALRAGAPSSAGPGARRAPRGAGGARAARDRGRARRRASPGSISSTAVSGLSERARRAYETCATSASRSPARDAAEARRPAGAEERARSRSAGPPSSLRSSRAAGPRRRARRRASRRAHGSRRASAAQGLAGSGGGREAPPASRSARPGERPREVCHGERRKRCDVTSATLAQPASVRGAEPELVERGNNLLAP